MKQKFMGKFVAFVLVLAMILSSGAVPTAVVSAKAKTPKLSKKSISLKVGETKKVTVKNKPKKAKVSWSSKDKKIATVSKGKIKGKKAGKTKVIAKLTYKTGKKKISKKLTVSVKVTKKTAATKAPGQSQTPGQQTAAPSLTRTPTPARTPNAEPKAAFIVENGSPADSNLTEEHTSRYGAKTKDNGMMRIDLSALDHQDQMGLGWNVGNSLEQVGAGSCTQLTPEEQNALSDADWVKGYETNAGNAVSTQKLFDGLKRYGINTIRIPIAWSNMMIQEKQADGSIYYRINEGYFDRVEEVINYCLNDEMYVVINDHWDGQWWGMFGDKDQAVRDQAWKKYEDMWKQIADRYVDYSDRLIFEGGNEELGERLNDNWKGDGGEKGVLTPEETFAITNQINQKFVDIIRSSGVNADGTKNNNYYRLLLIPGYDTNLHQTCGDQYSDKVKESNDALTYTMPTDVEENKKDNKFFVSIHYYDPLGWGIAKTAADGPYNTPKGVSAYTDTWGIREDGSLKQEDYDAMQEDFDAVNKAYISQGYGVIFGEFGVVSVNKDGIPEYYREFFKKCKENDCIPLMWDAGGIVDRKGSGNGGYAYFIYEDIGNVVCEITGQKVELKDEAAKKLTMTGKPEDIVSKNQDPLVVATWEGDFMRNTTASESVSIDGIRTKFGDEFIMEMDGQKVGAYFNTKKISYHPNYEDLKLVATSDQYHWHSHFQLSDWTRLKEPCVRITMHDDDISKAAQLQLVYTNGLWVDGDDYDWRYEADYEQAIWEEGITETGQEDKLPKKDENGNLVLTENPWQEKVLHLNPKYLEMEPVVMLTTDTYLGVDFVKVEFCDAAYNADGTEFVSAEQETNE